jgi:hypothetical protein
VDAEAGLDRLAAVENGRQEGLDEDREVDADVDLGLG